MVDTLPTLVLSPLVWAALTAVIVPILTGILTKYSLNAGVKALITAVVDVVAVFVVHAQMLPDGTAVLNSQAIFAAILAVAASMGLYTGAYVPWKLTNKPDGILFPNVGIGPKT